MNLLDALRHAEQQGKRKVHRGAEKVHGFQAALQRRISGRNSTESVFTDPEQDREAVGGPQERTGIVSVNGRDVEQIRCTGGRRTA